MLNERLLQFIWQFQYFNRNDLQTDAGETLQIIQPGNINSNQGPDFLASAVRIGNTLMVGSIELHIKASDWNRHRHQTDSNYNNVILHVVWKNDLPAGEFSVPVFVLQDRIAKALLSQYDEWMQQQTFIACVASVNKVNELVWISWKERLLAERLERKATEVLTLLSNNRSHWEETLWQMMAKNFGMKINTESFEALARSIPVSILAKQKNHIACLEALLLGQAGLLEQPFYDEYPRMLKREYQFMKNKYRLKQPCIPVQFLRMRPAAFPTIRLAQLAMLIKQSAHLFSTIKEITELKHLQQLLDVTANDYWHYHYLPDEPSSFKIKHLGKAMIDNICINTIIPLLFAYGIYHQEQCYKDKALHWLQEICSESNTIIKKWATIGVKSKTAYDSQSLIELKTQYCDRKRCLDCAIGNALLRRSAI